MSNYFDDMGFTCDVCGIKTNGCHYINGMKFCAKCYQEAFGKDNQQNEIQQIKQQLEEKDEQIKKRVMVYEKQFIEQTDEIYSLKQQLAEKQNTINEINKEFVQAVHAVYDWRVLCAEKDKEIEDLKTKQKLTFMHSKEDYFQRCNFLEEANIKLQFTQTQLAIQELEKVKELLLYEYKKYPIIYDKTNDIVAGALDRDKVNEIIDQQIEKLKGEHDE